MNRNDALDYLTRCADDQGNHWHGGRVVATGENAGDCPTCKGTDDAGHLDTRPSRYGWTSAHVAPVVWDYARRVSGDTSETELNYLMGLAVNDSETIEQGLRDYAIELASVPGHNGADIDAMVLGYLDCQLWAQTDYDRDDDMSGEPKLDANYDVSDISSEYVEALHNEIAGIVAEHPLAVRMYLKTRASEYFGHDFYLTREGHGAGFWDRGLGQLGDYLTQIAKSYGSADDLWDNGSGVLA